MTAAKNAFQLSRVYAQGWNAARMVWTAKHTDRDIANPYPAEPERSRWQAGFAGAQADVKGRSK
jgi:hypothetical protein